MPLQCIDNSAFELKTGISPARKRKRESDKLQNERIENTTDSGFTNGAFCSTPKRIICRRRNSIPNTHGSFKQSSCLEEKSIADIAKTIQKEQTEITQVVHIVNPYEVSRKPPKKKKKECEYEDACFINPALNLDIPDKQFNPFEVPRTQEQPVERQGFVNKALNLRDKDVPASLNPFEIRRVHEAAEVPSSTAKGFENLAMEDTVPSNLRICLPFTPTIGCRIDFRNIPYAELTPSKLLAEKLIFSPALAPKRSLEVISEESSIDIGSELDQYQLELENSINEAKLRKHAPVKQTNHSLEILEEDYEDIGEEGTKQAPKAQLQDTQTAKMPERQLISQTETDSKYGPANNHTEAFEIKTSIESRDDDSVGALPDVTYASDSEEEEEEGGDFKQPAPFVRAYRRADNEQLGASKESIHTENSDKSEKSPGRMSANLKSMKNMIRRSIRKLVSPHDPSAATHKPSSMTQDGDEKHSSNIFTNIRHSLRRREPKQHHLVEEHSPPKLELSIIDTSERKIKLKSSEMQTEFVKIEQLTTERKYTLRNSLRRSTRDIMKSVFHKNAEGITFK